VQTVVSAISTGTELLIYRGQAPTDMPTDETITALSRALTFPLKYGYAAVGRVIAVGSPTEQAWQGRLVFAFQPHSSHFLCTPTDLHPVPNSLSPEEAVFLPNMETAVNFLMDGHPVIGERVVVFGQGVVGLLTVALLARLPLSHLITVDGYPFRRERSRGLGAHASLDAGSDDVVARLQAGLQAEHGAHGADLSYELSGNPRPSIRPSLYRLQRRGDRLLVRSETRRSEPGRTFPPSRIRLISSQVSTIAPEWSGRWNKSRRLHVAWEMLQHVSPCLSSLTVSVGAGTAGLCPARSASGGGHAGAVHIWRVMAHREPCWRASSDVQRCCEAGVCRAAFLIGGDWGAENDWHSHHYQVEVQLQSPTLDQHGYLVDIVDINTHLEALVNHYRDKTLNDLPEFKDLNPSLEHFARIFCQALSERIQAPNLSDVMIKMWENDTTWAAYQLERSCASASSSTGA
jgi:6-pyruvoyl-tetrahydropterin synthase/NADPH:quinone reductase-like Zn-dependent oxidoreductase